MHVIVVVGDVIVVVVFVVAAAALLLLPFVCITSVDIPNAQESGNNGEEQDIGSVVDGVDFVDKSAAKFSVLSRSASARLTYFVDRSNNSKDGTVSEGSSLNSAVRCVCNEGRSNSFIFKCCMLGSCFTFACNLARRVGHLLRIRQ